MGSDAVLVFATFHPKQGRDEEVRKVLKGMVADTRAEPGNEVYDLYSSDGDEGRSFHLFERYRDQGALRAHRDAEHYKAYRAAIPDLLREPIGVVVLKEVDAR
jgi:quinol monooxygenase YgiN